MKKILKNNSFKKTEKYSGRNLGWDKSETKLTKDFNFHDLTLAAEFLRSLAGQFEEMEKNSWQGFGREIKFTLETQSEAAERRAAAEDKGFNHKLFREI